MEFASLDSRILVSLYQPENFFPIVDIYTGIRICS